MINMNNLNMLIKELIYMQLVLVSCSFLQVNEQLLGC